MTLWLVLRQNSIYVVELIKNKFVINWTNESKSIQN